MHNHFTNRLMAGALVITSLGCGGTTAASEQLDQMQSALVPTGVTAAPNDTFSPQLKNDIAAALAENQSVPIVHPELLPPNLVPDLLVGQDLCKVWVSFYSEGAGNKNTLGYFVYQDGAPPASVPLATRQANIIFSNASAVGSGGNLVQGNRWLLGTGSNTTFSKGSRIGFYLVADGWNGTSVDFSKPNYYTVDALNPESTASKKRHGLIVHHADSQRLILGFEDLNRDSSADNDFNDVVFAINWAPQDCLIIQNPGIDPDSSCQAVKTRDPNATTGWYNLDPCGTQGAQKDTYYCDMDKVGANGIKGGWTVAGWQQSSATTTLGLEKRGVQAEAATNWSRPLTCLPFNEVMVFNKTNGQFFTDTLRGSQFKVSTVPYALGEAGHSFNQGRYGPDSPTYTPITQGCVGYNYDGSVFADWACVTDYSVGGTAKGHIADYALDYNCNPAPAYDPFRAWAWANDSSCNLVGQDYLWGVAVR
ncbi:DUF4114 domain-containing protein [Cystobacter fuscus]|uniref:DUF4114 domain-containing protein n=1 Tax=Cystobacter fuscus TaxID=43 RepID=UPI002B31641C|nr:DUF4114 domain-containing protein [Cystobacter fuscus]